MRSERIVETRNLRRIFKSGEIEIEALRGIDLVVRRGEFVAVAGPSGSGKTTLFNLIGGLDLPTEGEVFVDGAPIAQLSRKALSHLRLEKIGFVFQAYNLIPVLSAFENVEYPLLLRKRPAEERERRVTQILSAVGLSSMMTRRPAQMSGGQQQRVAVARALVGDPVIVLADEPTANLDSETGKELIEMMRRLNETREVTFLFSTHDPMVMAAARRLVRLRDGRIVEDTTR